MQSIFEAMRRSFAALPFLLLALIPLKGSEQRTITQSDLTSWSGFAFRIEDSKTRVGFASVNLSVSELKPVDGELIGHYTIEVPLMKSKNDSGRIVLPLNMSVSALGESGGVLRGKAISIHDKHVNQIVCEISSLKNKDINLAITTSERTLYFDSKYTVIEVENGG